MKNVKGVMRGTGRIGTTRFFRIRGQKGMFAGEIGGATAEQIATLASFARTRENNQEFGGCANVCKAINDLGGQIVANSADNAAYLRAAIMKIKEIQLQDTVNPRGERDIELLTNGAMLTGIEFNTKEKFASRFKGGVTISPAPGRNAATIGVDAYDRSALVAPIGATHFEIVGQIISVSSRAFNPVSKKYDAANPTLEIASPIATTGKLDVASGTTPAALVLAFAGSPIMTTDVVVLALISVTWYQLVGVSFNRLFSGDAGKVLLAF